MSSSKLIRSAVARGRSLGRWIGSVTDIGGVAVPVGIAVFVSGAREGSSK